MHAAGVPSIDLIDIDRIALRVQNQSADQARTRHMYVGHEKLPPHTRKPILISFISYTVIIYWKTVTASPITAIKWLDTREVTVLTTAHQPQDTTFVKRTQKNGSRQEVLCPKAIADYTLSMGGWTGLTISDLLTLSIENRENFGCVSFCLCWTQP
ncbi:hypothetical protein EVAR_78737_1 [Eumeta japonica]|uniref:Uncharacterized protein n=1 Tax=Eumeta variegata TaxID=151549 RepID=A0A4C1T271_EUMVA|nr:hypothetical protein EVAR_78737_1 [Eumeta japonica]